MPFFVPFTVRSKKRNESTKNPFYYALNFRIVSTPYRRVIHRHLNVFAEALLSKDELRTYKICQSSDCEV